MTKEPEMSYLVQRGSVYYFRRIIPIALRSAFGGKREFTRSLGVKDREAAKRLVPHCLIATDKEIDEASQRLRKAAAAERASNRLAWDQEQDALRSADLERLDNELEPLEPIMDAIEAGTVPDVPPADLVRAGQLLAQHEREMAKADREAEIWRSLNVPKAKEGQSIMALFERYCENGDLDPKTIKLWRSRVKRLVDFLGHDDVTKVTRPDLNRWVTSLIAGGLKGRTITDGYLPAVRTALNIAYDEGLIPANPASGLKVRAPKRVQLRERELTDAEAETILKATLLPQSKALPPEHALARRWVPWLCAYTGARVGEITQLRACDILQIDGVWCVHITPEAGSVKTSKARKVPLHPHLIEQGFIALANAGNEKPLFYREGVGSAATPGYGIRANDLGEWVRKIGVDDPEVQPNHGWRHRLKTLARLHGIPADVADAIQGHVPQNEGGKYGSMPLPVLKEAIERLPRYEIDGAGALV